jgi:two-component system chemotaxis response regulator CheY
MKVLVVDDSATMRRIIINVLIRLGYENNFSAEDGIKGLKVLDDNPDIELIITDWNMPEMNGLEMVKAIKKNVLYKDIPIIMVTTEGGKTEVITALKAGVNNYVVKPFTPEVLKDKLKSILN